MFSNQKELMAAINANIDAALREAAPKVKDILLSHIKSDIYDAYDPKFYERRGALESGNNIVWQVTDHTLVVKDMTPGNTPIGVGKTPAGNQLIGIIQTGAQGNGLGKWKGAFARPAVANAQDELDNSSVIRDALKNRFG